MTNVTALEATLVHDWGGALAVHELVQSPDGIIGTKWMEEIIPVTKKREFGIRNSLYIIKTGEILVYLSI